MNGWMDGWMDGWVDGWMDGWFVFVYDAVDFFWKAGC